MKRLIILMLMIASTTAIFAQKTKQSSSTKAQTSTDMATYACPMHPGVTSDKPGKCSECGMALVKTKSETNESKTYTCPMHSDVVSNQPGDCQKCGMPLVEKKSGKKEKKKGMKMKCCM